MTRVLYHHRGDSLPVTVAHVVPFRALVERIVGCEQLEAMDDTRLRNFAGPAHVVVRVNGTECIVFRRYEHGKEVAVSP